MLNPLKSCCVEAVKTQWLSLFYITFEQDFKRNEIAELAELYYHPSEEMK